jgi:plasmid stability protein
MEDEERAILRQGVSSRIQAHLARLGGVELKLPGPRR